MCKQMKGLYSRPLKDLPFGSAACIPLVVLQNQREDKKKIEDKTEEMRGCALIGPAQ